MQKYKYSTKRQCILNNIKFDADDITNVQAQSTLFNKLTGENEGLKLPQQVGVEQKQMLVVKVEQIIIILMF